MLKPTEKTERKDISDRPGRFRISGWLVRSDNEGFRLVMANVNIVRAEHLIVEDVVEYVGLSSLFEKVAEASKIPFYRFTFKSTDGGLTMNAEKYQEDICPNCGYKP